MVAVNQTRCVSKYGVHARRFAPTVVCRATLPGQSERVDRRFDVSNIVIFGIGQKPGLNVDLN
jgi:hypothetical protein